MPRDFQNFFTAEDFERPIDGEVFRTAYWNSFTGEMSKIANRLLREELESLPLVDLSGYEWVLLDGLVSKTMSTARLVDIREIESES